MKDYRSGDRLKFRMPEFEMHPSSNETGLNHRATPGRSVDRHRGRLRAKHRMSGNQSLAQTLVADGVRSVLRLDFQHRSWRYITQMHTSLNLRLNDVPVHGIAEMWTNLIHP